MRSNLFEPVAELLELRGFRIRLLARDVGRIRIILCSVTDNNLGGEEIRVVDRDACLLRIRANPHISIVEVAREEVKVRGAILLHCNLVSIEITAEYAFDIGPILRDPTCFMLCGVKAHPQNFMDAIFQALAVLEVDSNSITVLRYNLRRVMAVIRSRRVLLVVRVHLKTMKIEGEISHKDRDDEQTDESSAECIESALTTIRKLHWHGKHIL